MPKHKLKVGEHLRHERTGHVGQILELTTHGYVIVLVLNPTKAKYRPGKFRKRVWWLGNCTLCDARGNRFYNISERSTRAGDRYPVARLTWSRVK